MGIWDKNRIGAEAKFWNDVIKLFSYIICGTLFIVAYMRGCSGPLYTNVKPSPNRQTKVIGSRGAILHQEGDWQYRHDVDTPGEFTLDYQRYLFRFSTTSTADELGEAVREMSQHPYIVAFDFTDCKNMNDGILKKIAIESKGLLDIRLANCRGVTDVGLSYLARMGTFRQINIGENNNISDMGIKRLVHGNRDLEAVEFNGKAINIYQIRH